MSGFTREELLRLSIPDLEAAEKADETERHMRKIIGSGSDRFESRHVTKDGRIFDVEISVTFLANKRWFIVFVRDISNRKQAEQTLAERTTQLETANNELESFSYSVSHDLRAPLRAIDGYARMILKRQAGKFDEDTLSKFNVIRSSTQMMGQLIDDLLAFSRLGRKNMSMSMIDMDQLVREVWTILQDVNPGRNMIMTVNGIPSGCGDRSLIKQVYFNLISNAVKFTKYRDAACIEAGGHTEGNENIYYVRDNGTGFDMAYYDKLFGVFQRLHSSDDFEGTGVGLATVQRIVHRHGGRVWAEGEVDEGATFYFSLPSSERPASAEMAI
jgi:light-regulated signal transduction histidine kinase (bacteriophytochrome)